MKEVVENGIGSEVVAGLPEEFQERDMVDALSRVEQKSLGNWKELDNESKDIKVERDAKREGEPTILATFGSDREARFEDERSTTSITKTNDINTELPVQDLEETIRHKPNKQKSLGNWKELDNESKDRKVEMAAKREGEPTILATFGSDRGITIWDPGIKSAF
ncbi:hypothetical protein Tco_0945745 [Tanacetum coccineum]